MAAAAGGRQHRLFRQRRLGATGRRRRASGPARRLAGARGASAGGGARHRGPAKGRPARCPPLQLPGRLRRHAGGAAPARRRHRDGLVAGRRWPHGLARRGAGRRGSVLPAAGAWRPAAAKRNLPGHRATARQRPGRGPVPAPAARAWRRPTALPCVHSRCAAAVPAAAGTARRRPRRRRPRQRCREPRTADEPIRHPRQHGLGPS